MEPTLTIPARAYWEKIDLAQNQQRWYQVELEVDLFGAAVATCCWGRIGRPGQQSKSVVLESEEEWPDFFKAVARMRVRRGYSRIV